MCMQEQEAVRWQEQRKTMQEDKQGKAELAQYQDEVCRLSAAPDYCALSISLYVPQAAHAPLLLSHSARSS